MAYRPRAAPTFRPASAAGADESRYALVLKNCCRSRSACRAERYSNTPNSAFAPPCAKASSCFSPRSHSPAKQRSSNKKVRLFASSGFCRISSPIARMLSDSLPARNNSVAFICDPVIEQLLSAFIFYEAPIGLHLPTARTVWLLFLVRHLDLAEVKRELLGWMNVRSVRSAKVIRGNN